MGISLERIVQIKALLKLLNDFLLKKKKKKKKKVRNMQTEFLRCSNHQPINKTAAKYSLRMTRRQVPILSNLH